MQHLRSADVDPGPSRGRRYSRRQVCSRSRSRSQSCGQFLSLSVSTNSDEALRPIPTLIELSDTLSKLVRDKAFLCRGCDITDLEDWLEPVLNNMGKAVVALLLWGNQNRGLTLKNYVSFTDGTYLDRVIRDPKNVNRNN